MAADGKQLELWKTVVGAGGVLIGTGAALLAAKSEFYGAILLGVGLLFVVVGLAYAAWQQHEWRRPPRLSRGLTCTYFPLKYEPRLHGHPYYQELAIGVRRPVYPPDLRIICSAPILHIEGQLLLIRSTGPETRTSTRYQTSIDGVSLLFPPLEPIEPPATIFLSVFSDERIRVRRIKRLKTKYPVTPSAAPAPSTGGEQSPPSSPESSESSSAST